MIPKSFRHYKNLYKYHLLKFLTIKTLINKYHFPKMSESK